MTFQEQAALTAFHALIVKAPYKTAKRGTHESEVVERQYREIAAGAWAYAQALVLFCEPAPRTELSWTSIPGYSWTNDLALAALGKPKPKKRVKRGKR